MSDLTSTIDTEDIELRLLLEALYQKYHYDFRGYSMASIKRRLTQACNRLDCQTFSELQSRVLREPELFTQLLSYLTVQVSEMFRDPKYYKSLRENVIPHLRTYPSLKVWVAGCSHGEELYSLAILFREEGLESRTIFYATDINPAALQKAREGIYSSEQIPLFTQNHQKSGGKLSLSSYYTEAYGAVRFDKSLVKNAVFSDHSLVTDEVFAEMHLVSCRNVLIYFDRPLQDRAICLFNRSLALRGFLGLGAKESLTFSDHKLDFEDFDPANRIYQKR